MVNASLQHLLFADTRWLMQVCCTRPDLTTGIGSHIWYFGQIYVFTRFFKNILLFTGVKPFDCPICGKSFLELSHLRTHSVVHTGEEWSNVKVCRPTFLRSTIVLALHHVPNFNPRCAWLCCTTKVSAYFLHSVPPVSFSVNVFDNF